MTPSEVRERIRQEHERIRAHVHEVDQLAERALQGRADMEATLRDKCTALQRELAAHLDLEDAILAPALRDTPGFGAIRAEQLLAHHVQQRGELAEALHGLNDPGTPLQELAVRIRKLASDLLTDMEHEDRDLLSDALLRDDPINIDEFGG
jgi:iron-sulfur cluster repair protein YtfE (RIC family)